MNKIYNAGILGCGDFLRWMTDGIKKSNRVKVKSLYDPDAERAKKFAGILGGRPVSSAEKIFKDDEIDMVYLFVPPWVRKELLLQAAGEGKHILTTKPLGPNTADCSEMVRAVEGKVKCGVIYCRTGNAMVETLKKIFTGSEIGNLSLYKQDWLHHYPEWNKWATDPDKNGGPFMDAMIHNMNIARYLMGRRPTACTFFSESHAHSLKCSDTEFMKLDFEKGGSAHLFITWAADLAVYSKDGNDREHIDLFYMVTDKGWRLTEGEKNGKACIIASREGKTKYWEIVPLPVTPFDEFAESVDTGAPLASDIVNIREACEDIKIIRTAMENKGCKFELDLSLA